MELPPTKHVLQRVSPLNVCRIDCFMAQRVTYTIKLSRPAAQKNVLVEYFLSVIPIAQKTPGKDQFLGNPQVCISVCPEKLKLLVSPSNSNSGLFLRARLRRYQSSEAIVNDQLAVVFSRVLDEAVGVIADAGVLLGIRIDD